MYKNWQDWQGGALDVWKETPASDIGEGLIRHEWQGEKYNLLQKGTTLKADVMNSLQMGLDFLIDSNHTVVNSEDHYTITIDGLKTSTSNPDGYELSDNLHFSIKITEENANGISKLIINGDSYDLQKKISTGTVDLEASDLQADKIFRVYYDGTRFIVDASSLPAKDNTAGVMSINDVKDIILSSYSQKLATPGYVKLSNGFTLQWFTGIANASSGLTGTTITFPVAFGNNCLSLSANDVGIGAQSASAGLINKFSCRIWSKEVTGGAYATGTVHIIAIGY